MRDNDNTTGYAGSILTSDGYSATLVNRVKDCITRYRDFEETGSTALLYIAAWKSKDQKIWYEYASKHFTKLLDCEQYQIADVFRLSVKDRRIYKYLDVGSGVQKEIISQSEISNGWEELREEGKNSGNIEAVYKLAIPGNGVVWLKDQATVEFHQEDNICLSLGLLTIISKEMEVEDKLKKHHDKLEITVQERNSELVELNKQLKEEIEERESTQQKLKESYQQLLHNLDEMVHVMSLTIEQRDPYTAGHQKRTTDLAIAIAKELKLSEHKQKGLQMAGLIHDMGKISVPGEILSKPGRLNDAEIQLIKRHPKVAYDILHQINFPWPVDQIVLQHHEKMDGSGYPGGLKGDQILMEARVLCVADVVETIETHRPYRPGLGREAALAEIINHREILYDADVVDACLRLFTEKDFQYPVSSLGKQAPPKKHLSII